MARVTVEDCLEKVDNRFALVLIAAQRTRQIIKGAPTLLDVDRDNKEAVIALREIADGLIPYEIETVPSDEEVEEAVRVLRDTADAEEGPDIPAELFASLRELSAGEQLESGEGELDISDALEVPAAVEPAAPSKADDEKGEKE